MGLRTVDNQLACVRLRAQCGKHQGKCVLTKGSVKSMSVVKILRKMGGSGKKKPNDVEVHLNRKKTETYLYLAMLKGPWNPAFQEQ